MYYRDFFYQAYFSSRGYCPSWPIGTPMHLGDMIKILPGKMNKLGNIYYDLPLFKPQLKTIEYPALPQRWQFQKGLNVDYSAPDVQVLNNDVEIPAEFPLLRLQFGQPGSFFFEADRIDVSRIANFDKIKHDLVQHLCAEYFSFQSVYVVTEIARVEPFSFLLAREARADLYLQVPKFTGFMPLNLTKLSRDYKTLYTRGLDQVHIAQEGCNMFFRASKLELTETKRDELIRKVYDDAKDDSRLYLQNIIDNALTDMISRQEVDPMNSNNYYDFHAMTMDDIAIFLGDAVEFYY